MYASVWIPEYVNVQPECWSTGRVGRKTDMSGREYGRLKQRSALSTEYQQAGRAVCQELVAPIASALGKLGWREDLWRCFQPCWMTNVPLTSAGQINVR